MNGFIIILSLLLSSCASKYMKQDPKFEDIPQEISEKTIPAESKTKKTSEVAQQKPMNDKKTIVKKNKTNKEVSVKDNELVVEAIEVPWKVGEQLKYEVTAIGMDAAQLLVEVLPMKILKNQRVWHFNTHAKTQNTAASLFYFNSKAESFVNEQLHSLEYRAVSFEGDHKKTMVEKYDMEGSKYFAYKKKDEDVEKNGTKDQEFHKNYVDLVYLFYHIRRASVNTEFALLNNHKQKVIKITKIETEVIDWKNSKVTTDKMTLEYEGKIHTVYREKTGSKRILKAIVSLSFASGTVTLSD